MSNFTTSLWHFDYTTNPISEKLDLTKHNIPKRRDGVGYMGRDGDGTQNHAEPHRTITFF